MCVETYTVKPSFPDYYELKDSDGHLVADYIPTREIASMFSAAPALLFYCKALVANAEDEHWNEHWLADIKSVIQMAEGATND